MVLRTCPVRGRELGQSGTDSDAARNQVVEPDARQQAHGDVGQTLRRVAHERPWRWFEPEERTRDCEIENVAGPVFKGYSQ